MRTTKEVRADREKYSAKLLESNISAFRDFCEMEKRSFQDGAISAKMKELMALSIAVVLRCSDCIQYHVEMALKSGATKEEIFEASGIAVAMAGGPAFVYSRVVARYIEEYYELDSDGRGE